MVVAYSSSPLKKLYVGLCLLFYTAHLFFQVSSQEFHMKSIFRDSHQTILQKPFYWKFIVYRIDQIYYCRIFLGNSQEIRVEMSTTSYVSWVLCEPCYPSYPHPGLDIFNPRKSSSFRNVSCLDNTRCNLLNKDCDANNNCRVSLIYVNPDSRLEGLSGEEKLLFRSKNAAIVEKFYIVCIHQTEGPFSHYSVGSICLTRDQHSFVRQLREEKFAYCLPILHDRGWIAFGDDVIPPGPGSITIPLVNPDTNLYNVQISSFMVDEGPIIMIPQRNGVFMVSIGTFVTVVDSDTMTALIDSINSVVTYPVESSNSYRLCLKVGPDWSDLKLPEIKVQFGTSGDLFLNRHNYFLKVSDTVGCFTFLEGIEPVLGNQALGSREVMLDLSNNQITFGGSNRAC